MLRCNEEYGVTVLTNVEVGIDGLGLNGTEGGLHDKFPILAYPKFAIISRNISTVG
jgi:hypothetical protein